MTKNEIEDLLCGVLSICLENNGGSLEEIFDHFRRPKLTKKEKDYIKDLLNWDE